jgi:hypothetical protein
MLVLIPALEGVEMEEIAIAPERGGRLIRPLGHTFQWVFARDPDPSRAVAPSLPTSGDLYTRR